MILPVMLLAATVNYSPSERRTLQEAVTVQLYASELQAFYKQCRFTTDSDVNKVDAEQLNALLKQQIGLTSQQFQTLLHEQPEIRAMGKKDQISLQDCQNTAAYMELYDDYELKRFSLEISTPLSEPPQSNNSKQQQVNQKLQAELDALLLKSKSVVTAVISNRDKLTPVEQANYLHIDYQSPFLFKIEQGWRNPSPAYIGLHLYIDRNNINQTSERWLIFLDQNNHIIEAKAYEAGDYFIQTLGKPEWRLDSSGNIQR